MPELSDEQIAELIRSQPRRMPSQGLWLRVAAEAERRRRRVFPYAFAAAGALAAVAGLLLLLQGKPSRVPRPSRPQKVVQAPVAQPVEGSLHVAAGPVAPKLPSALVPLSKSGRGVAKPRVRTSAHRDHVPPIRTRPDRRVVAPERPLSPEPAPPEAHEAAPLSPAPIAPQVMVSASRANVAPAPQAAASASAPAPDANESRYYIEVTQGDRASVLQGSVTRDDTGRPVAITLTYDGAVSRNRNTN